jgi:hypothetical protein
MAEAGSQNLHLKRESNSWLFIPPLVASGIYPDQILIVMLIALLGTLLLGEALRSLSGGLRREMLIPFFFCLGLTTFMLLVLKISSFVG